MSAFKFNAKGDALESKLVLNWVRLMTEVEIQAETVDIYQNIFLEGLAARVQRLEEGKPPTGSCEVTKDMFDKLKSQFDQEISRLH